MELTGKVIAVLDTQIGTSSRGNLWEKKEFVIETHEQYPKRACFTLFNKVEICPNVGEVVTVSFDMDAHEYNGRWFNQVNAWKVDREQAGQSAQANVAQQAGQTPFPPAQAATLTQARHDDDDIPF